MPLLHPLADWWAGSTRDWPQAAGSRSFLPALQPKRSMAASCSGAPQKRWAQISLQAELEAGADLECYRRKPWYSPVPAGAAATNHLAPGASWLGADVVRLATARGEDLGAGAATAPFAVVAVGGWSALPGARARTIPMAWAASRCWEPDLDRSRTLATSSSLSFWVRRATRGTQRHDGHRGPRAWPDRALSRRLQPSGPPLVLPALAPHSRRAGSE